jgi:hypothetical protein
LPAPQTDDFDRACFHLSPGELWLWAHCCEQPSISNEVTMRMLRWMIAAGAMILTIAPAMAQRYDPAFPVCLQKWEWGGSSAIYCNYTSWDDCQMAASGLSAMCLVNPYWSRAHPDSRAAFPRGKAASPRAW